MPQEPKKRHSRQRQGKRRAAIKLSVKKGVVCPNCGTLTLPHRVCKKCGFYKGREVRPKKTKKAKNPPPPRQPWLRRGKENNENSR